MHVTKICVTGLVISIPSWDFWNRKWSKNNLRAITLILRPIKPVTLHALLQSHIKRTLCTRCVCFICNKFEKMFTWSGFLFFYSSCKTSLLTRRATPYKYYLHSSFILVELGTVWGASKAINELQIHNTTLTLHPTWKQERGNDRVETGGECSCTHRMILLSFY